MGAEPEVRLTRGGMHEKGARSVGVAAHLYSGSTRSGAVRIGWSNKKPGFDSGSAQMNRPCGSRAAKIKGNVGVEIDPGLEDDLRIEGSGLDESESDRSESDRSESDGPESDRSDSDRTHLIVC